MPDLSAIPNECINTGTALQTDCAAEFSSAQAFFGINVTSIAEVQQSNISVTQEQIQAYVAQAPRPSPQ
jgi:hypothetical protein